MFIDVYVKYISLITIYRLAAELRQKSPLKYNFNLEQDNINMKVKDS